MKKCGMSGESRQNSQKTQILKPYQVCDDDLLASLLKWFNQNVDVLVFFLLIGTSQ